MNPIEAAKLVLEAAKKAAPLPWAQEGLVKGSKPVMVSIEAVNGEHVCDVGDGMSAQVSCANAELIETSANYGAAISQALLDCVEVLDALVSGQSLMSCGCGFSKRFEDASALLAKLKGENK